MIDFLDSMIGDQKKAGRYTDIFLLSKNKINNKRVELLYASFALTTRKLCLVKGNLQDLSLPFFTELFLILPDPVFEIRPVYINYKPFQN